MSRKEEEADNHLVLHEGKVDVPLVMDASRTALIHLFAEIQFTIALCEFHPLVIILSYSVG